MQSHLQPPCGLQWQSGAVHVFTHWLQMEKKKPKNIIYEVFLYKTSTGSGLMRQRASSASACGSSQHTCAISHWLGNPWRRKMDADRQTSFSRKDDFRVMIPDCGCSQKPLWSNKIFKKACRQLVWLVCFVSHWKTNKEINDVDRVVVESARLIWFVAWAGWRRK